MGKQGLERWEKNDESRVELSYLALDPVLFPQGPFENRKLPGEVRLVELTHTYSSLLLAAISTLN